MKFYRKELYNYKAKMSITVTTDEINYMKEKYGMTTEQIMEMVERLNKSSKKRKLQIEAQNAIVDEVHELTKSWVRESLVILLNDEDCPKFQEMDKDELKEIYDIFATDGFDALDKAKKEFYDIYEGLNYDLISVSLVEDIEQKEPIEPIVEVPLTKEQEQELEMLNNLLMSTMQ
jgi:tRNA(Ile)-lysidine synthase TilS/MesJ